VFRWLAILSSLLCLYVAAAPARTRPHYGGTLRVDTRSDPLQSPDGLARRLLADTLTRVDDNGLVLPALAVRWESQNANHRWQLWLRPGVHFHDGMPLTAAAVAQSLSEECGGCPWRARAVGESIVITSESPMPGLPAELARGRYVILRRDDAGNLDGTGPFRVAANSNGILLLSATDDSWDGRPFVDSIEIHGGRSIRYQWLDLSVGRADIVEVPAEQLHQAQQDHMPLAVAARASDLLALTIAANGALRDVRMREAIAVSVDRAALFGIVYQKQGEITASILPEARSGYGFLFATAPDLARARELRGQQPLPLLHLAVDSSDPVLRLAADRLALNLRDSGFNVQVVSPAAGASAELMLRLLHLEAEDAVTALREMLSNFGESDFAGGGDPATLYRVERSFLQSYTVVPLLYLPRAYGLSGRVRNLALAADGSLQLAEVSLEAAK
jgi:peptide/nickel transport system substrate-binding protein